AALHHPSLHDALPIFNRKAGGSRKRRGPASLETHAKRFGRVRRRGRPDTRDGRCHKDSLPSLSSSVLASQPIGGTILPQNKQDRSEEHTSELQSLRHL